MVESAACDADCTAAQCGDSLVNAAAGEACDDGAETATCDADCTAAQCGDSVLNSTAGEQCDDGNMVDTDACVAGCKSAKCGDGFVRAGAEECDDGNATPNDGCENDCKKTLTQRYVFVTSQLYNGNLGGLAGADAKCQARAAAGNLPGTYKAWLSDNTGAPANRLTQSTVPYVLPNGTKVANNWADLTDGTLLAAINVTELGGPAPIGNTLCLGGGQRAVWSNTTISGLQASPLWSCSNWTSSAGSSHWGLATSVGTSWTNWCNGPMCSYTAPIYCVQQ